MNKKSKIKLEIKIELRDERITHFLLFEKSVDVFHRISKKVFSVSFSSFFDLLNNILAFFIYYLPFLIFESL